VNRRPTIPLLFLLITACGPTEVEKNQVAMDVYTANESRIKAKREAMREAFARVDKLTAEEKAVPFDLKEKPPVDITTYPENGYLALKRDDIEARFLTVESLRGGFEIHRNDSLEDVKESAGNAIKGLDRLRYFGVIKILELKEPEFTGRDEYKKSGITMGFVPGKAKARVFVFDLTDGEYLGSLVLEAQNSPTVKMRPTGFDDQVKFELRQKIKEAAVTRLQFWDEVNRKK
jgi:hypothetical protein